MVSNYHHKMILEKMAHIIKADGLQTCFNAQSRAEQKEKQDLNI
jgi:hypothetical protein